MAVRYYGVNVGGQAAPDVTIGTSDIELPVDDMNLTAGADVTIGTSTTSSDIELAVDDTNLTAGAIDKRQFIEMALEAIFQSVNEDTGI